jgi:Flp pilus assembly protein TadB
VRVLPLIGIICVALALYAADRLVKARARARRRRSMSDRLDAATVRVEEQIEQRQAAEQAGQALTSFMPAIQRPPSELPAISPRGAARPRTAKERAAHRDPAKHDAAKNDAAKHDHESEHGGRRTPRSGEHKACGADRSPHGEAAARVRSQHDSRPAG